MTPDQKRERELKEEFVDGVIDGMRGLTVALHDLGTANSDTQMGALELLSLETKEGSERIAEGLGQIASAIQGLTAALLKEKATE